jgi:nicotinate-nucleotide--dimethylbenzimidazole phosphoribosyltransferase
MLTGVPGTIDRRIGSGTADITEGPAMSRAQAEKAVEAGIGMMQTLSDQGFQIAVIGEMGIGNTTAASAVTSVLLHRPPETVTGRGAGLSDAGLCRKLGAIHRAIEKNHPNPDDPMDVLARLGGFELAGMAGAFLGGIKTRIPVIPDGMIPAASALIAARIDPAVTQVLLPGAVSREPADHLILEALGLNPVIHAETALGEGTGGIMLLPLLDLALKVYFLGLNLIIGSLGTLNSCRAIANTVLVHEFHLVPGLLRKLFHISHDLHLTIEHQQRIIQIGNA